MSDFLSFYDKERGLLKFIGIHTCEPTRNLCTILDQRINPSALVPSAAQCVPQNWSQVSQKHSTQLAASLADCREPEWAVAALIWHHFTCKRAREKTKTPSPEKQLLPFYQQCDPTLASVHHLALVPLPIRRLAWRCLVLCSNKQGLLLCHGCSLSQTVTSTQSPLVIKNTQLPVPEKRLIGI